MSLVWNVWKQVDDLFSLQIASFFAVCLSVVMIICRLISPVVVYNKSVLVLLEFVYQCVCISLCFRVFVLLTVPVLAWLGVGL